MEPSQLDDASQALQSGNETEARSILRQILSEGHTDQEAWLMLAELVEQPDQKIFCLQQVLLLDAENQKARAWLEELQSQAAQPAQSEPLETSVSRPESVNTGAPAKVWQDKTCPFLGLEHDRQSFTSYPSAINYCYRLNPAKPINQPYQASHCLNENHKSCKLLQDRPSRETDTKPQPDLPKKDS